MKADTKGGKHGLGTWYAVALEPGASRFDKRRWVEAGPRHGRHLRNEERQETVVERGCRAFGIECYIPFASQMIIHHRSKKPTRKRFPMVPGFAFVRNVRSFIELEQAKGVWAVLGIDGEPYAIHPAEILDVQIAETASTGNAHSDIARWHYDREKLTKRRMKERYPPGSKVRIKSGPYAGKLVEVNTVTGRRTIQAMMALLGAMVPVEIDQGNVEKYEVAA